MARDILVRDMVEADLDRIGMRFDCRWRGRCGERRGAIIGYAAAFWAEREEHGYVYVTALSSGARQWWLPIEARRFLARLDAEEPGLKRLLAYPDCRVDRAVPWLQWLGFAPTGDLFPGTDDEIWAREMMGSHDGA